MRGCHHVFQHPDRPGHLTVPHPKKVKASSTS
ncbi:type II toxin-antitoxin system HicA family toxin [Steroidobacter gossypii]